VGLAPGTCLELGLEVEHDESHEYRDEQNRTAYLEQQGFLILRFWNREVDAEPDAVLRTITHRVDHLRHHGIPPEQRRHPLRPPLRFLPRRRKVPEGRRGRT
jgi:hypothetical protein